MVIEILYKIDFKDLDNNYFILSLYEPIIGMFNFSKTL